MEYSTYLQQPRLPTSPRTPINLATAIIQPALFDLTESAAIPTEYDLRIISAQLIQAAQFVELAANTVLTATTGLQITPGIPIAFAPVTQHPEHPTHAT